MLGKRHLTSVIIFCTPQFCLWDTRYTQSLYLLQRIYGSQKWKGNAAWCLEITLQFPPHTTTLETMNCFVAPFAGKNPSFPVFPSLSRSPLSFSASPEDAAVFPSHAQTSNSAKNWRPSSVLSDKWEVRKSGGSFQCHEDFCCGMGVFLELSTSSLKWLGCLPAQEDQLFYLLLELLRLPSGEVLTMAFSLQQARGPMQHVVETDTDLWSYQYW